MFIIYALPVIGHMPPVKRQSLWKSKRVFFLTAQVLQNDLGRGSCNAEDVVLLVFDEAHKALGNHAYCQVILFWLYHLHDHTTIPGMGQLNY